MRIHSLHLQNYKSFTEREFNFHPQFNLLAGPNGAGKTSLLDALAIAAGSWFLGVRGADSRHIRSEEVRLQAFESAVGMHWEAQYPCRIQANGEVLQTSLSWTRSLHGPGGRTTQTDARQLKKLALQADSAVRQGGNLDLPLLSYYGVGRLWQEPRDDYQVQDARKLDLRMSRLDGYLNSVDPRLSVKHLSRWIAQQTWIAYQRGADTQLWQVVRQALLLCLEGGEDLYFDAKLGEIVVNLRGRLQPFSNLSDGQRCMLALVGDIARKACILNPHLGPDVLLHTRGMVLIDELDLHLHPAWQQHVVEDLRTCFPGLQFICSTHSPFLIQSLRSGDELLLLEGAAPDQLAHRPLQEIVRQVQKVTHTETSLRYAEQHNVASEYLQELERLQNLPPEERDAALSQLADTLTPYAENPAFQAVLERKRVAKLGV
ncbi:AAA family ATPase [Massilia sp. W12]|uniref:AAA family ATPase n=1 Tax=Massilia sp. W12 TaxID=3126507 RepID=UPI0030D1FD69